MQPLSATDVAVGGDLLATGIQEAAPVVGTGSVALVFVGLVGLFVRQLVSQQGGWQVLVTAAEHRAAAAEAKVLALEVKVVAHEARIEVLKLEVEELGRQMDELRLQLEDSRKDNTALREKAAGP